VLMINTQPGADDKQSKAAEQSLRRIEAENHELEAILDTAPDGVLVLDRAGRVLSGGNVKMLADANAGDPLWAGRASVAFPTKSDSRELRSCHAAEEAVLSAENLEQFGRRTARLTEIARSIGGGALGSGRWRVTRSLRLFTTRCRATVRNTPPTSVR